MAQTSSSVGASTPHGAPPVSGTPINVATGQDLNQMLTVAHMQYSSGRYTDALSICENIYSVDAYRTENLLLLGAVHFQVRDCADGAFFKRPDDDGPTLRKKTPASSTTLHQLHSTAAGRYNQNPTLFTDCNLPPTTNSHPTAPSVRLPTLPGPPATISVQTVAEFLRVHFLQSTVHPGRSEFCGGLLQPG